MEVLGNKLDDELLRVSIPLLHVDNHPVFNTTVLTQRTINVVAIAVLDDNGGNGGGSNVVVKTITDAINAANPILRQKAIKLIPPTTLITTNRSDWLIHTNAIAESHPTLFPMFTSIQAPGKLKVFYVNELWMGQAGTDSLSGVCTPGYGIAIRKSQVSSHTTLAHELIHNYLGIWDLYNEKDAHTVSGNPTRERLPKDWVGAFYPFYPKNRTQEYINEKLLMNGIINNGGIIPFGKIFGVFYETQGGVQVYKLGLVPVGQEDSRVNFILH